MKKNFVCNLIAFFLGAIFIILVYNIVFTNNNNIVNQNVNTVSTTTVEEQSDLKKAITDVYESVVYIEVTKDGENIFGNTQSSGSGFVYKKDKNYGYILTNYHVIENGDKINITYSDSTSVEATLVGGDEYIDVAILKVDLKSIKKVATLGDSSKVEVGDTVFTVGAPFIFIYFPLPFLLLFGTSIFNFPLKYLPVKLFSFFITSLGVPKATIFPPCTPAKGPISTK